MNQNERHGFDDIFDDPNEFAETWKNINRFRQASAHTTPVTAEDKKKLDQNIDRLIHRGTLTTLLKLKEVKGSRHLFNSQKLPF